MPELGSKPEPVTMTCDPIGPDRGFVDIFGTMVSCAEELLEPLFALTM